MALFIAPKSIHVVVRAEECEPLCAVRKNGNVSSSKQQLKSYSSTQASNTASSSLSYSNKNDYCNGSGATQSPPPPPPSNAGTESSVATTTESSDDGSIMATPRTMRVEYTGGFKTVQSVLSLQSDASDDSQIGDEEDGLLRKSSSRVGGISQRTLSTRTAKELWPRIDPIALQFGLRMAILLTVSGFFVIGRMNDRQYPDGMWVLISVLFVCWFPSLDAASVIEKIIQRLIGTFVGASLGLLCGFTSLWVLHDGSGYQILFLSVCMFVVTFGIIFLAGQCKVGGEKYIVRFSYATILCVLTFCIAMLPFGQNIKKEEKWLPSMIRIVNVIVGCLLGAIGSITICPKSTHDVLFEKTARQVRLAGEASEAVLQTASDHFSGLVNATSLADEILHQPRENSMRWKLRRQESGLSDESASVKANIAVRKYEAAIMDWKATKTLLPLTMYDPFSMPILVHDHPYRSKKAERIQAEVSRTLARALRIQTTIIVMDGMVRNDTDYEFTRDQLLQFSQIGCLIRRMLTVPLELVTTNAAAEELFHKLEIIRSSILYMSARVAGGTESSHDRYSLEGVLTFKDSVLLDVTSDFDMSLNNINDDDEGRGVFKNATSRHDNTLFFLQLVEHLILRALRLYQAWKHVEIKSATVQS